MFVDPDGMFPKEVLSFHKTVFYRADYYTFTRPAAHIISLVTGVKEEYIRGVNVMEKGFGHNYPMYNPNIGGGGITIGSNPNSVTMTFTENYFADDATSYNGNGYGQNVTEWLSMASHEATHIKHIEQAGGKIRYLLHFGVQYLKHGHNNVPEEKEADANREKFNEFNKFIRNKYGKNALQELFKSDFSDSQKVRQIDSWWKEFNENGNAKKDLF